jgi:hypothetical protein
MNLPFELVATPLACLAFPVLLSLLARDALVFMSVASVTIAGGIVAAGVGAGREQWLVVALISLAGMVFTVHGYQSRNTVRSIERLKDYLLEVRLATASLRNAIEQERGRSERKESLLAKERSAQI